MGRFQGQYGLISDNIVDASVVTADGNLIHVSNDSHPDLFWALRGAGHNFGIVTDFTMKAYDLLPNGSWFYETLYFSQDKLEALVATVDDQNGNGTQPGKLSTYGVIEMQLEMDASAVRRSQCQPCCLADIPSP